MNARKLLKKTGFGDISVNASFSQKPTTTSIGVIAGNKTIEIGDDEATLIALAIRGGGYEAEWASNFAIGSTGAHEGFDAAKTDVLSFLETYISENSISGAIKIWVTGYSRAAATANLVAGALDDQVVFANCTYQASDVYAYTFETPRGVQIAVVNSSLYDNIFNIVNDNDPVPKVAPAAWDFIWYGVPKWLPTQNYAGGAYTSARQAMLDRLDALGFAQSASATQYRVDDFTLYELDFSLAYTIFPVRINALDAGNQSDFLNETITTLVDDAMGGRANYVQEYEAAIKEVFSIMNLDEASKTEFWDTFRSIIEDDFGYLVLATGHLGGLGILTGDPDMAHYLARVPLAFLAGAINEAIEQSGVTGYSAAELATFANNLASLLLEFFAEDPDATVTLIKNGGGIQQAHYPEICLAWVQSMDSFYTSGGSPLFAPGAYRVAKITGVCDVNVYSGNELVASITSDVPDTANNNLSCVLNADGEKLVYLPSSGAYTIELTSTGDGTIGYCVQEYNSHAGYRVRNVSLPDEAVVTGDMLSGDIPVWSDPITPASYSQCEYALVRNTPSSGPSLAPGNTDPNIPSDSQVKVDLVGEDARNANYNIELVSANEDLGVVYGSGVRSYGSYAKANAYLLEDSTFVGWYIGDELVSTNQVYQFKVQQDVLLTAVFAPVE